MGVNPAATYRDMTVPAVKSNALTLSQSNPTDINPVCRGLWVGTGGDLYGWLAGDDLSSPSRPFKNIGSGVHVPYGFKRIDSGNNGTTVSDVTPIY